MSELTELENEEETPTLHKVLDLAELLMRLDIIHAQYCHKMRVKIDRDHYRPCGCTIHNLILDVEDAQGRL